MSQFVVEVRHPKSFYRFHITAPDMKTALRMATVKHRDAILSQLKCKPPELIWTVQEDFI